MLLQENCNYIEDTLKIKIPEELKSIWLNEQYNDQQLAFTFYNYGVARLFKAHDVMYRDLKAIDYYQKQTNHVLNDLYGKYKAGDYSMEEYESLKNRLEGDPLLFSNSLTHEIVSNYPHLNIRICLVFAQVKHSHFYYYLFYGFDAAGNSLGVYLWELDLEIEMPLFIDFSIKDIIPNFKDFPEEEIEYFDHYKYLDEKLSDNRFIDLPGLGGAINDKILNGIMEFYKMSVAGTRPRCEMVYKVDKNIATIKITIPDPYGGSYLLLINFNDNDIYKNIERLNREFNFFLSPRPLKRTVDDNAFYLVMGKLCYVDFVTAIDFSKKGVLRFNCMELSVQAFGPHYINGTQCGSVIEFPK